MKVLLLKDVYNLGRAGEVKKVANGYGRNYLLPQNLAALATPGALLQSDRIAEEANKRRTVLNTEMQGIAEKFVDLQLHFAARAGEAGKLYGSVTTQMIAEELANQVSVEISKRQIDSQPLRLLGMHTVKVRLTMDIIPEISVVVYREGEAAENYMVDAEELASQTEEGGFTYEDEAEVEADENPADDSSDSSEEEADDVLEEETVEEPEGEEPTEA